MGLFDSKETTGRRRRGIVQQFAADLIKWEPGVGQETEIIAHRFEREDFPNGSQLIVHPSQIAVFINNLRESAEGNDPGAVAIFSGPCRVRLDTGDSRFAPFRRISRALTGGESAFHSSVVFLSTVYMTNLNWGTQAPIVIEDPEEEVNVHIRAFGLFGAHIEHLDDSRSAVQAERFLRKVVGTRADFTRDDLVEYMRARILEYVPDLLAKRIIQDRIGVLSISTHLSELSEQVKSRLEDHFDEFGMTLDNFSFHNINVPDEDLAAINDLKVRKKQAVLEAQGTAARMDIESEARARMRRREGYTYQQEQAFGVMQAAAANEGAPSGFAGAGMGLGMGLGLGGAFGTGMKQIASETIGKPETMGQDGGTVCPACQTRLPAGSRFCLNCGKKIENTDCCPDCGARLIPGAKFCLNCGRRLGTATCPGCGKPVESGSRFCMNCGMKLEKNDG